MPNLIESIRNVFSKAAPAASQNPVADGTGIVSVFGDVADFDARDSVRLCRSIASIAAGRNASEIASAQLRLYYTRKPGQTIPKNFPFRVIAKAQDQGELIEITEHPSLTLLEKCNPFRNHHDFFEETSMFLDCTGDAYWWVKKGPLGVPSELWVLNSARVTIIPDDKLFIKGYMYGRGAGRVTLRPDEVIHFRRPNMRSPFYGQGRIEQAFWAIDTELARQKYEDKLFKNNGVSELVVKYDKGTLDARQRRDVEMEWTQQLKSQRGVHVADQSFSIDKIAFSPREMIAMQSHAWNIEEITNAFGQPKALYADNPNRASIEGAIYQWGRFELDPSLSRIAEKLNESYFPLFDDCLWCEFDAVASRDREFDLQQEQADLSGHVRSVNEIRASRQLAPLDDERADDPFALASPAAFISEPAETPAKQPSPPQEAAKPAKDSETPAKPTVAAAAIAGDATVADTALNGAQVTGLIAIVQAVSDGILSVDAGVAVMMVAFPTIAEAEARKILSTPIKPKPKEEPPIVTPVPPKAPEEKPPK